MSMSSQPSHPVLPLWGLAMLSGLLCWHAGTFSAPDPPAAHARPNRSAGSKSATATSDHTCGPPQPRQGLVGPCTTAQTQSGQSLAEGNRPRPSGAVSHDP